MISSFCSYGDLGDIIYLAPCMKLVAATDGPVTLYGKDGLRPWDPLTARLWLIEDLFKSQPYVEAVLPYKGEHIDFDASMFRDQGHPYGVTLAALQAQWIGLNPNLRQPWLSVAPDPWAPIIVARSFRYRNRFFPWRELVDVFHSIMLFIGLDDEYADFCENFGHIERLPTAHLNAVAKAIAGCEIFIGNQSSPFAIAEALKHRRLLEVSLDSPDCIYGGGTYCYNGGLDIEILGRRFQSPAFEIVQRANINETPPNGWRVNLHGHFVASYALEPVLQGIQAKLAQDDIPIPKNLKDIVIDQSSVDLPPLPIMASIRQLQDLLAAG